MDLYIPQTLKELLPDLLLSQCKAHPFAKGEYLFHPGKAPECMFFIVSGEAVLSRSNSYGEASILQRCKGGFLSEASLLTDEYHCDAITTHAGTAITLPIQSFRSSLKDEQFSSKWIKLLSREIMRLRTQSERLGLKDIKSKLIHLIETDGKRGTLVLESDYKSLASELGITHEALYRALSKMEAEGLIEKQKNSLRLVNKLFRAQDC
ncbi:Crp/Fnr family transcriptional regulator [Polynucleobacter sp. MWH-UH23A]|uniref:Crp/Fnr family transcriptional regulator n=1 Tax=Polynucleobacter sp. MWH-UH23A TaxID=1855613 RepID=UPI003364B96E